MLTIVIETSQGKWENAAFAKTTKIQDVIQATIQHFGFASGGNYEMRAAKDPNIPLKRERPLVSYGIRDGDVLTFSDLGGGVWL